ncbi:hypothetical protein ACFL4D_00990 [Candidatus Margulisiibacteriota bacterium]
MKDDHVAVLLEDLNSQFKAFGEGLENNNRKLDIVIEDVNLLKEKADGNRIIGICLQEDVKEIKQDMKKIDKRLNLIEIKVSAHDQKLSIV